MPITPHKGESQGDFMARCMHELSSAGATARPQDQKVAICMTAWREEHGGKPPAKTKQCDPPGDDESYSDFMDRCDESGMDEDACQTMWDENNGGSGMERAVDDKGVHYRTMPSAQFEGMDFILSDATPDRFDDVIKPEGWDLDTFKRNPISLFNHNKDFVVGTWQQLRVQDGALQGRLKFAPEGTSPRIDEIRKLVEAGILRAVSVGFRPIASEPRKESKTGGITYLRSELVECSVVAVPANPNALAIAKSLNLSDDTLQLVFAEHGKRASSAARRGTTGEHAKASAKTKGGAKMSGPIATRIKDTETRIVKLKDELAAHLEKVDDENPDEAASVITDELTAKIDAQEKMRDSLKKAEAHIMASIEKTAPEPQQQQAQLPVPAKERAVTHFSDGSSSALEVNANRPFAIPAKKLRPSDYLWRSLTVQFKHYVERGRRSMNDIMVDCYGEDVTTKTVMDIVTRAASAPAMTTVSGWAQNLTQIVTGDLIEALVPTTILPRLGAMGTTYNFGRNHQINLPARTGLNLGGGFLAEGAPIPVKQGAFTTISLTPKKLGVISTMTREMTEYSIPAIEGIIREGIVQDTGAAIDAVLMDNNAATAIRPQGLQNAGSTALGPTAGGTIAAFVGDLRLMVNKVITGTAGNVRKPVWIMNPGDVLVAALTQATATGDFPFRDELGQGRLLSYPVIQSTSGTSDTMYLLDAADFATSVGTPTFDVSDVATLHMEDTTPAQIVSGTGPTVATPVRSLFQTDSIGIRLTWNLDWAMRRTGVIAWITNLSWN